MNRNNSSKSAEGIVYLVGAGPGDVGLFTLRGMELLQQADVVVYDALVGSGIVALIPDGAERVYVGKRNHHHTKEQDEISRLLVEKAREGKRCVRLKGGDPYLFGRGGEEAQVLKRNGIPFETVSGVTSAFAVPASVGIPVTHREYASSVHIITAHRVAVVNSKEQPGSLSEIRVGLSDGNREMLYEDEAIDYKALLRAGGTYVFLMGLTALPKIVKGFLQAGMREDMPVAVISNGTTAAAKKTVATLTTIAERASSMPTPAVIVVGEVCALSEELDIGLSKELFGRRIIVCSSARTKGSITQVLRDKGAEVIEKQMINVRAKKDQQELRRALERMSSYQWLVFTSPEGVRIFFAEWREMKRDIRELANIRIAAIGEKTASEIESRYLKVDLVPANHEGGAFGKELAKVIGAGEHVLIPRAQDGGAALVEEISRVTDVVITDIPIYETELRTEVDESLRALVEDDVETMLVFASASSVNGFLAATRGMDYNHCRCVCIGNQTKTAAEKLNLSCFVSKEASMESLFDLILESEAWN